MGFGAARALSRPVRAASLRRMTPTRFVTDASLALVARLATLKEVPYFIEQGYNGWQRVTAPFKPPMAGASNRIGAEALPAPAYCNG